MAEYDQSDDNEKKIDNYLGKFDVYLDVVVEMFTLTNIFFLIYREDGSDDHFLEE